MMTRPADPAIDEAAAPSRSRSARALVQAVRWRTGLSQVDFARVFHIDRPCWKTWSTATPVPTPP
jgi:putative transcriptional regulator